MNLSQCCGVLVISILPWAIFTYIVQRETCWKFHLHQIEMGQRWWFILLNPLPKVNMEPILKHPLNNSWTLWFYKNESRNWEENQRQVFSFDLNWIKPKRAFGFLFVCLFVPCHLFPTFLLFELLAIFSAWFSSLIIFGSTVQVATFDTVEDFWALMNYVSEANNLPVGSDYSLFKVMMMMMKTTMMMMMTIKPTTFPLAPTTVCSRWPKYSDQSKFCHTHIFSYNTRMLNTHFS